MVGNMCVCVCARARVKIGGGGPSNAGFEEGEGEKGEGGGRQLMEQKRVEEKKKKIGEKGDSFKKKNQRRDGMEPPLPSPQALATTQY